MDSSELTREAFDLYHFQQRKLPILLGWSAASVIGGGLLVKAGGAVRRAIGWQFILWGLIDGAIAVLGLRGAQRKAERAARGEIALEDQQAEAAVFERILWINAALDVLYVLTGGWLIYRHPQRPERRGMGWGILLQGAFLLVWDIWLGRAVHERRRSG